MSPRAACRLASLGFDEVYDYLPSKADWLARGLPREGEKADETRAADLLRSDVVTCRLDERIAAIRPRVEDSPYNFAFAVSSNGVVLGRLRKAALAGDDELTAEDVMEPGPSTTRADVTVEEMEEKMARADLTSLVIADPDGVLMGIVRRRDL